MDKDPQLWSIAKKRAGFKSHLAVYLIVNAFLWALWYFNDNKINDVGIPWPAWSTFGWGIGVFFNYLGAYVYTEENQTEKEYKKLLNEKQKQ